MPDRGPHSLPSCRLRVALLTHPLRISRGWVQMVAVRVTRRHLGRWGGPPHSKGTHPRAGGAALWVAALSLGAGRLPTRCSSRPPGRWRPAMVSRTPLWRKYRPHEAQDAAWSPSANWGRDPHAPHVPTRLSMGTPKRICHQTPPFRLEKVTPSNCPGRAANQSSARGALWARCRW